MMSTILETISILDKLNISEDTELEVSMSGVMESGEVAVGYTAWLKTMK
jgi:hypothetical protein